MSYRIETSTFIVTCDKAEEVADLIRAIFGRCDDEIHVVQPDEPDEDDKPLSRWCA